MAFATLPALIVNWTQVTPAGGDTFSNYSVYRRNTGTTTWTRIATAANVATVAYNDFAVASGQSYDYTVTATYTRSGTSIESVKPAAVSNSVAFTSIFLHDPTQTSSYLEFAGNVMDVQTVQSQMAVLVWGRAAPTMYIGPGKSSHIKLTSVPQVTRTNQALWNAIDVLIGRQYSNASVLLLRDGETGGKWFAIITPNAGGSGGIRGPGAVRKDRVGSTMTTIDLDQVQASEAV